MDNGEQDGLQSKNEAAGRDTGGKQAASLIACLLCPVLEHVQYNGGDNRGKAYSATVLVFSTVMIGRTFLSHSGIAVSESHINGRRG